MGRKKEKKKKSPEPCERSTLARRPRAVPPVVRTRDRDAKRAPPSPERLSLERRAVARFYLSAVCLPGNPRRSRSGPVLADLVAVVAEGDLLGHDGGRGPPVPSG